MRGFFFAAAAAALCAAALCVPVRLELLGAVETGSGRLCLIVRWLLLNTRIQFDLCLLDAPAMTVMIRHGRALTVRPLLGGDGGEKPTFIESLRRTLRIERLRLGLHVGVRDDPATTVLLGGLLQQAARIAVGIALPESAKKQETVLHPCFDTDLLRLDVLGIAKAFPAQIIYAWIKNASAVKSAKNSDTQKRSEQRRS